MPTATLDLGSLGLCGKPLLCDPQWLERCANHLGQFAGWPHAKQLERFRDRQKKQMVQQVRKISGRVAILPVHGFIEQRGGPMSYMFGGFSTDLGEQVLSALVGDRSVGAIVLHVDSPGGTSYGVPEFAERVYEARKQKPTYCMVDSMMASAALWIGSAASTVVASPSGDVGSLGVYTMHADMSAAAERDGVKVSIIRSGKYKAEGNPYEPLTKEARDHLQEGCDELYSDFLRSVARNRGASLQDAREKYGQGRLMTARGAHAAGLVDRLMSFSDFMDRLGADVGGGRDTRAAAAEILRLRHEHRKRLTAFLGADLTHDSKTSDKEPSWSAVDKTKLPRVAFADHGEADKKSTWGYPHHFVTGGAVGDDGVYDSGYLWLHKEGLNAAWAAANGARSGEKASPEVIAHLQAHRRALGLDKGD